jgi:hypothetical protein
VATSPFINMTSGYFSGPGTRCHRRVTKAVAAVAALFQDATLYRGRIDSRT